MKKVFVVIMIAFLFIGCSKKEEGTVQGQVQVGTDGKATEVKASSENKGDIAGSYKWAVDFIKGEAEKNGVMVDAFELSNAKVLYLTPAQVMNGWESNIELNVRYAMKENTGTTWYDLNDVKFDVGGWYTFFKEDHTFTVRKIKEQYVLDDAGTWLKFLNSCYSKKSWLEKK